MLVTREHPQISLGGLILLFAQYTSDNDLGQVDHGENAIDDEVDVNGDEEDIIG